MRLRVELAAVIAGFIGLNLLLVLATVGLFLRMGPAIDGILTRNDATIVAAEELLEVLATSAGDPIDDVSVQRMQAAIERTRANVTEEGEDVIVADIQAMLPEAVPADSQIRAEFVARVRDLVDLNRKAMNAVDLEAQRLGQGGAWAAAFVGLAMLALGAFFNRTLIHRVIRPVQELRDTLRATTTGDPFRRCSTRGAATELQQALESVNHLLDERPAAEGAEPSEERFPTAPPA